MNRRQVLAAGVLTAGFASTPLLRATSRAAAPAEPFSVRMPVPPVLRPAARLPGCAIYHLTMREAPVEILPGRHTTVRTFDGSFPGPTIRARRGETVIVRQTNKLDVPAAVHLHGGHVEPQHDGHPMDVIAPGDSRTYVYPNRQRAAALWYHDHAHHLEAENVYRGLAGLYLLTDPEEERLGLPRGEYELPLLLRGANLAEDGTLIYDATDVQGPDHGTTLVNGRPTPYLPVAARRYRFRIANVSSGHAYVLKLRDGSEMIQIGTDGGLLPEPVRTGAVSVWSAERADVVIDFSRYPVGSRVYLDNTALFGGETRDVLRFDVVREARDDSRVPERLVPLEDLGPAATTRTFALSFDLATGRYLINGAVFDPDRVDARPRLGVPEIWEITNSDTRIPIPHTFHTHLEQFRILDRNGVAPPAAERGRKDTLTVHPGETVRIKVRFSTYTGRYVFHCHMLEHSAHAMMGQLQIEP
ncbi:multicopper oxidase family protein [Dactylosporangium fulvum]